MTLAQAVVALSGAAHAQDAGLTRPELQPHRFDEDWRALCAPAQQTEVFDGLKCIALGKGATLTLGGELRERFELVRNPDFGIEQRSDRVLLHRAMLHADLRIGDSVRAFAQFGLFDTSGRQGPETPTDVGRLDLVQGFVDVSALLGSGRATLRGGRQEMSFGSSRLVGVREGPNVRRAFDGVRALWSAGERRADAFYVRPVTLAPGAFDDQTNDAEAFWGVYGSSPVMEALKADVYYLGLERDRSRFALGTDRERRHTIGVRLFGRSDGWDWDVEAAYQFGSFGARTIRAWTVASDVGFTFEGARFSPRLGLKADIASGDRDPADGRLGTFNALYPKLPYFSEASLVAPANIADLHPTVGLALTRTLSAELGWNFLWRETTRDAVYGPPLAPIAGTAGRGGRFIGHQLIAGLEWQATPNLTLAGQYVHFTRGDALRADGGRNVDFLFASAAYKF
ncbi:MAG TPA: alginate export family protein [Microvirga sp.]|nr:alginate export family protein [Microvirga sp.]